VIEVVSINDITDTATLANLLQYDSTYGIERGLMTTIHSYTNDQVILDSPTRTCAVDVRARGT
jgi:glyceraldehyde-3-phosphate dehydrogenase/erythrose-4-phosphate dehydrogenase